MPEPVGVYGIEVLTIDFVEQTAVQPNELRRHPSPTIQPTTRRALDKRSQIWEHQVLKVYGESTVAKFARKHPAARRPLQRFLEIVRDADGPHFTALKQSFAAADYAPSTGTLIFDIGGNKYRLIARVDFGEQVLYVESVLTHGDYNRESL